jgi:hypothetical protein
MPPRKDDASVETLREAARTFMDATSLRQAARDIGMSPTGLRGFLDGAAPYVKTERKLRAWYLREAQRQVQAVSPEAANNALRLLVGHFAPAYARETTLELVDVLERRCIDSQTPVPAWIAEVRGWYSE